MPKLGMEPLRRAALVEATIAEIGHEGSLDVTVGKIAKRAGVSSGLAHHYFGGKDDLFLAAMAHILAGFRDEVRAELRGAHSPRARLEALIRASFAPSCFEPQTIAAWLNFYVMAQTSPRAEHLLQIYQARLRSNLRHALRGLTHRPEASAETLAALIDGHYLRQALRAGALGAGEATRLTLQALDDMLESDR
ncbi:choline-binding transcriptional repressor BetI [Primorskyibacter sp. S187A]|uniref:choline-binding transcriptional repressor BetI n=1 Tax=Primorskyibacter sp. S187A TaxID=3415130 RepID=UPI003C7A137B